MGKLQMKVLIGLLLLLSAISFELYGRVKSSCEVEKRAKLKEATAEAKVDKEKESDTIELGIILALSGVTSNIENGALLGAEIAVEELNSKGGALGKEFRLLPIDNRGTQLGSREAARIAASRGVAGVIGPERSSYALSAAPVLQESKIPTITHLATHTDVTKVGDYIFRACFTDELQGTKLAEHALSDMEAGRAVVLRMLDEDYSMDLSRHFRDRYKELGGEVLFTGNYKSKEIDYSNLILKIKEAQPELIFIAGYTKDVGLIARQAGDAEIDAKILTGDGIESSIYNFGGTAINGLRSATHWHEEVDSKKSREFEEKYIQKHNKSAVDGEAAALSYDATLLLGEAIVRSNSLSGEAIKKELRSLKDFKGATGSYSFDENGDPTEKSLIITEFGNGKRELAE